MAIGYVRCSIAMSFVYRLSLFISTCRRVFDTPAIVLGRLICYNCGIMYQKEKRKCNELGYKYNRDEQDIITNNRKRIYEYIVNNPGSHIRKIRRELNLSIGHTQYHLKVLEKTGFIRSLRTRLFRRYYTTSIFGERQEFILAVLGQEVPKDIILYLIENPGATQGEIAHYTNLSAATINWHMSRLTEIGLVTSHKKWKYVNYYVEGNIKDITTIHRLGANSLTDLQKFSWIFQRPQGQKMIKRS